MISSEPGPRRTEETKKNIRLRLSRRSGNGKTAARSYPKEIKGRLNCCQIPEKSGIMEQGITRGTLLLRTGMEEERQRNLPGVRFPGKAQHLHGSGEEDAIQKIPGGFHVSQSAGTPEEK